MTAAAAGRRLSSPRDTLRGWAPAGLLAVVCYVPLLLTHRGQVGADTKSYLYLDPGRLLGRAWSMWDPNVGLGTVPHQNIGYLWPMGPFYWLSETLGLPDWLAQRLWLGSILFLAGLGVRYMLRALGQSGPGVTAAMFLYALSPYVLTLGARISALLLPFTALGWMIGLTVRAARERTWVHPALFALAVPTFGSTNATALLLVGVAPALWVPYATFVLKEIRFRAALAVTARIGILTLGASLWWIVGLWAQGSFGIDVLRYTETAKTVADASTAPELLRGLGYWYFYGDDKLGAWIEPSGAYTQSPGLILITYAVPIIGLVSAAVIRWRHRSYFVGLVVIGLVIAVGAHPWDDPAPLGEGFKAFLQSQAGLAMRSLPRAVPVLSLGLAVLTGTAVTALGERVRRWERPAAGAVVLLAIVALPPLWRGQMVADNLQRPEEVPTYWTEAAAAVDAGGRLPGGGYASRILEVPGADFASYRWGDTVDPITPGLTDRPYVARELIPYGTPPSADLLNSLDRQLQEAVLSPDAVAPVARLMGAGVVLERGDLAYERYNLVRPRQVYELLREAPGLGPVEGFGGTSPNVPDPRLPLEDEVELGADPDLLDPPRVGLFPVTGDPTIVAGKPQSSAVLLSGSGEGIIAAAAAGLIEGDELVLYSASFAADGGGGPDALVDAVAGGAPVVITDTNRKSGQRWGVVHEADGLTETVDEEPLISDPSDNRLPLFPGAGPDTQTVAVREGVTGRATGYGNSISYTPEDRPSGALDDDLTTSWSTAAFAQATGERIEVTYDSARTTDRIRLLQAREGIRNRWITDVRLTFDGGDPVDLTLSEASRDSEGEWLSFPERTFSTVEVEITGTDTGQRDSYDGLSAVGFADLRLGDGDVRLDESIRPPTDALSALGPDAIDHPLAFVFTRRRARPTAALRSDPELTIVRDLDLPSARRFDVRGTGRISPTTSEDLLNELLGRPTPGAGGVAASASRRLPGDLTAGATAAIDGDGTTHWSPGFLGQDAEWTSYSLDEPVTFDHMDLQVVADGRHTVPTRLRIEADGGPPVLVDVPPISDEAERDARTTVPIDLPQAVTGSTIRIGIEASREVITTDWVSTEPIVMPVGITEWGIEGVAVEPVPATFDSGCRDDLLEVDGEPVAARLAGPTDEALAGDPLDLTLCADDAALPEGPSQLRTGDGRVTGLQVDDLSLRSDAGGAAHRGDPLLLPDATTVPTTVTDQDRWRATVEVGPRDEETILVIGQSDNDGWTASIDGQDLGDPILADGYSSAFRIPAGADPVTVEVVWTPQRAVFGGLAVSAAAAVLCLLLALRPWRWRRRVVDEVATEPLDERPRPLTVAPVLRSTGSAPGPAATALVAVGAAVVGTLAVNPVSGLVLLALAVVGLRVPRARAALALGPAALLALAATYLVVQQVRHGLPAGFQWPQRFGTAHGIAYTAVLLLGLDLVVDRLRTGAWCPSRPD